MEDLRLLGIHGDAVTHTSDYFNQLYKLGLEIIKSGKAYCDDTEQAQVSLALYQNMLSKLMLSFCR